MTSTSFNTGYSLSRNSSKVIQPPGGQTANIFGACRLEPSYSSASSQAGSDVAPARVHIEDQHSNGSQQPQQAIINNNGQVSPSGSLDSAGSGQQQPGQIQQQQQQPQQPLLVANGGFQQQQPIYPQQHKLMQQEVPRSPKKTIPIIRRNPITGEILDYPAGQPTAVRVRQPPGGRSSGIFY